MPDLLPPPEVMLAWPLPNYAHPDTRGPGVLIVACVLGPIMVLTVAARLWARAVVQRNAGVDDWLMVVAMVPAIGLTVSVCLATEHLAYNRHIWDVFPTLYVSERKIAFVCYLLYVLGTGAIKISVLLFYRRLDSRCISNKFRIATWLSIISIALFVISFVVVLFVACRPFTAFWDQYDVVKTIAGYKYHCGVDESADLIAASVISAVQDAVAAFLPTILYWNLRIPLRQKIALGGIFALGYLVCAVAAVRVYYVWRTFNSPLYDSTWEAWAAWLLCMLEVQLGAICASAPALKVFFGHYFRVVVTKVGSSGQEEESASWKKIGGNGSGASYAMSARRGDIRNSLEDGLKESEEEWLATEQGARRKEEPRVWRF